jgi:L-amino acid N-acyltransferase YncA
VRTSAASFETEPPDAQEMQRRLAAIRSAGLPYWVAERAGSLAGYAYAGPYRPRAAYRFTLEDSVYVAPEQGRRGVGRALLERLITECERIGCRQLVAVIGDSANFASIALHHRCGFAPIGTLRAVGWKHGRWIDSVLMQRPLGTGDGAPPPQPEIGATRGRPPPITTGAGARSWSGNPTDGQSLQV